MNNNKLLVVLDFNGTILDSTHHKRPGITQDCMARFKYVYFRPGMRDFLAWLLSHPRIDVGVWTSNIAKNAMALVNIAFTDDQQRRLAFVYTRAHCTLFPDYSSTKPMQTIVDQQSYSADRVLVVDDSPEKIEQSTPPVDYYHIPTFEAVYAAPPDNELAKLQTYIERKLY